MLANAEFLKGLSIHGFDGDLGVVEEFYFEDDTWAIRYLTIGTGLWLNERQALISPMSVVKSDWPAKRLDVGLTKAQVENSPDLDVCSPVTRKYEAEHSGYYGYPNYWDGPFMWGPAEYPSEMADRLPVSVDASVEQIRNASLQTHLRSSKVVTGYHVEATDGEIGHVDGFIIDDQTWAVRYLSVATRNWLPGKKVLISPSWVSIISWEEAKVHVGVSREAIKSAPEYLESRPITREYEKAIHVHYDQPPYWLRATVPATLVATSKI